MTRPVEVEQEEDGRWIAEIPELSGALSYGQTEAGARSRVQALALRILADRREHGEQSLELGTRTPTRLRAQSRR